MCLLKDRRLSELHTSRDRHSVRQWTRGPSDQTTQIVAIHTYTHTYTFTRILAPLAIRQPTRPLSSCSRLQRTSLRFTVTSRVSSRFLLPADPPVRHLPTASRLSGDGNHAQRRPFRLAHHPRALHRAAACRVSRAVRPAVTSLHIRNPGFPTVHLDKAVWKVVVPVIVLAALFVRVLVCTLALWLSPL